jgi:RNA polymerase sigma-70 factor (ECF subfamily)
MKKQDLNKIYENLQKNIKWFILSRIKDKDVTEDILQEVYLKIHSNINSLNDYSKIQSWIYKIALNTITDHYRSQKKNEPLLEEQHAIEEIIEQKESERLKPALLGFIEQLPPIYRDAIKLSELQGLSQKELAIKLGISFSGAKSRVQRGRAMLKELLMKCCHFEFDKYGVLIDYHEISCCCCKIHNTQK